MKLRKIIIHKYRGISNETTLPIHNGVYPIIGINESGKTSVLQAISAFDYRNDKLHPEHISGVYNRFNDNQSDAEISCEIECNAAELTSIFAEISLKLTISHLVDGEYKYTIHILRIINGTPEYTVRVEKTPNEQIVLGRRVRNNFKPEDLFDQKFYDDAQLATFALRVNAELNTLFTEKWQSLHGSKIAKDKFRIEVQILRENPKNIEVDNYRYSEQDIVFTFRVLDNFVYFPINDRSKGFMWFFSFVYRTQLNPNLLEGKPIIYLFDEPGCYLHSSGQMGLCEILKELGTNNTVIYNTHSHYLLDYSFLPNVKIMHKIEENISLAAFGQYRKKQDNLANALQAIYDALKVEPSVLSKMFERYHTIFIVEGITDFYIFHKFVDVDSRAKTGIVPSTGAQNMPLQLATLLAIQKPVFAVFDGDAEAQQVRQKHPQYADYFLSYGEAKCLEDFLDKDEWNIYAAHKGFANSFEIKDLIKIFYKDSDYDSARFAQSRSNINKLWNELVKEAQH